MSNAHKNACCQISNVSTNVLYRTGTATRSGTSMGTGHGRSRAALKTAPLRPGLRGTHLPSARRGSKNKENTRATGCGDDEPPSRNCVTIAATWWNMVQSTWPLMVPLYTVLQMDSNVSTTVFCRAPPSATIVFN